MRFRLFALAALLAANGPALLPGFSPTLALAQQKQALTLEDIWTRPTFRAASVPGFNWMNDGRYYSALENGSLVQHEVTTGKILQTLVETAQLQLPGEAKPLAVDSYSFNADEQKILFTTGTEPIYRRSARASYYVFDRGSKKLTPLSAGGKQGYATFSPNGRYVAFTRDNNLFVTDLATMQEKAVTTNGAKNSLINGSADWVYEEEFSFAQGFCWSPDSRQIAFYTFDESQVPEYDMQEWGGLYPKEYRFKYPKAGEKNSVVSVSSYDVASTRTTKMDVGPVADQYIPRVQWTRVANTLSIQRLNRLQNKLEVLHGDASTGKTKVVLTDTNPAYVEINDDLNYLEGGKQFLFTSEKDGYQHLYLHDMDGKPVRQLTKGNWEISAINGFDAKTGYLLSACANGKAALVNTKNGKLVKLLTIGLGPDAVIMDTARRLAFIPCGKDGVVTVIALDVARGSKSTTMIKTEIGARTGALDPSNGTLYLPTARFAPPAAAGGRPVLIAGSFHVVVIRRE